MPNIKSAEKRVKTIAAKTRVNKMAKTAVKTTLKNFDEAVKSGSADLDAAMRITVKKVDKAASAGLLHKNTASRKKSAIARAVNAANAAKNA